MKTLDLRPYHIRHPYSPLRRFYAMVGVISLMAMLGTGIFGFAGDVLALVN